MSILRRAASEDLRTKQGCWVNLLSTDKVEASGAGELAFGVLMNNPDVNAIATVQWNGLARVKAGATVAIGAEVSADADGFAVTQADDARSMGLCLLGGDEGDTLEVLIRIAGPQGPEGPPAGP